MSSAQDKALSEISASLREFVRLGGSSTPGPLEGIGMALGISSPIGPAIEGVESSVARVAKSNDNIASAIIAGSERIAESNEQIADAIHTLAEAISSRNSNQG